MARTTSTPVHTLAGALSAALATLPAGAADHFDGPAVMDDPAADIADVYAWMSSDAAELNLVMDIVAERFSDAVQYVFHLDSTSAPGAPSSRVDLLCIFDTDQNVTCWLGDSEMVNGDASKTTGLASESGRMRVFAAKRSDPFFFNAEGFSATISRVRAAAGSLTFDGAGCPQLDAATSSALVSGLSTDPFSAPARNFFRARRVSSLIVRLDKTLVTQGGPIVGVSASTRR